MSSPAKNGSFACWLSTKAARDLGLAFLAFPLLAFHFAALGQQSATQSATEDQVKAAYLLNFAKLAEWPHQSLPDSSSPLVIGVSGASEDFLNVLRAVVSEKIVGSHVLVVRPVNSPADAKSCEIVFFRASAGKHAHAQLADLPQAGVLSVGEDDSFLRQGGMINLVRDHGSVRFEVNADALDRSAIHFSAKILALAKGGYESTQSATSTAPVGTSRPIDRSVPPEYPELARNMNLKGTAQVEAVVRPDGTVKDVRILGGHPLLADALARAVKQWRYQPAARQTTELVKFTFDPQ